MLEPQTETLLRPSGEGALALLGASDADAPALAHPGVRERLDRMLGAAFAQSATGLAADIASYSLQPWGFAPPDVAAKTLPLYGSCDPMAWFHLRRAGIIRHTLNCSGRILPTVAHCGGQAHAHDAGTDPGRASPS
jgi:hypothetical protein